MIVTPLLNVNLTPGQGTLRDYPALVFESTSVAYDENQALNDQSNNTPYGGNGSRNLWNPEAVWKNGKTVWAWQGPQTGTPSYKGQPSLIYFDEDLGYSGPHLIGRPGPIIEEQHAVPVVAIDNSGVVWVAQTYPHSTPLDVISNTFFPFATELKAWTIGVNNGYPNILDDGTGGFILWTRAASYNAGFNKSPGGFDNWSASETQMSVSDYSYRHYTASPINFKVNGKYYVTISDRLDPGWWKRHCVFLTTDFINYYNMAGTWVHNITTQGVIAGSNELGPYTYYDIGINNVQTCQPVTCVSPDGNFYAIHRRPDDVYIMIYFNAGAWVTQVIDLPDMLVWYTQASYAHTHSISTLLVFAHDDIRVIAFDADFKNRMWTTTDAGVTWVKGDRLFPEFAGMEGRAATPRNIHEIPDNRNFMIGCADLSVGANDYKKGIRVKKAAFGAIQ